MSLLPITTKVLKVFQLSSHFSRAVKPVSETIERVCANEIVVRNEYVGVNATDLNVTAGRYFAHQPVPYPLGLESLGRVVAVGTNVTNYRVGQAVVTKPAPMRAYAEYLVLDERTDHVTVVPESHPDYLALLGTSGLTAAIGLCEAGHIRPGETVLISAAAGGLGHIAAQWAQMAGCRVIALTSSKRKADYLNTLQLERVINYREEDLCSVLSAEYPNGIDVIWETIGTPLFEQLFEHLARKGRLVNVGATAGYRTVGYANINIEDFLAKLHYGARTVIGFLVLDYKDKYEHYSRKLLDAYVKGDLKIKCDLGDFHGLEGVFQAIERIHDGQNIGKTMVKLC